MKITNIELQKNQKRYNIYIDNKFAFGLTDELRFKFGLKIDDNIEQDYIDNVLRAEEQLKVTNHALNLLSFRQRSSKEIYTALKRKGYEDSYIEVTIRYLELNKYIDDRAFAISFINDKRNLNKYGSNRIKYELYNKGISKEIIEETLDVNTDDEYMIALEVANKKIATYKGQDNNSVYNKLGGFLQRKGYSYDLVSKVLREILKNR